MQPTSTSIMVLVFPHETKEYLATDFADIDCYPIMIVFLTEFEKAVNRKRPFLFENLSECLPGPPKSSLS